MNAPLPADTRQTIRQLMDHLAIADPQAARQMGRHLVDPGPSADIRRIGRLVDEVIGALAEEVSYGRALADGMGRLLAGRPEADQDRYLALVKQAAAKGPTLAGLFARHLVPVLLCGDARLADRFQETTRIMLQKGTYTLKAPLEVLGVLIEEKDLASAHAFLDLLAVTYAVETTYNRTVYLTHTLPRAVIGFVRHRRLWQIRALTRTVREDERLADDYLQGLTAGLHLLAEPALNEFLDHAICRYRHDQEAGARFLALDSRQANALCQDLQVAVPLSAVRSSLERYLHARTGLAVAVRPHPAAPDDSAGSPSDPPLVRCDGRAIYLSEEMNFLGNKADNTAFLKLLVRLEAGAIEFGTYDLDVEKALGNDFASPAAVLPETGLARSDLQRLLDHFESPGPALDLFTLFEHARIARRVAQCYPGLSRRLNATLADAELQTRAGLALGGTLLPLYFHLVVQAEQNQDHAMTALFDAMADRFNQETRAGKDTVETSARLTGEFYGPLVDHTTTDGLDTYDPLRLPFGRRLEPGFFGPFHTTYHRLALELHDHLAARHIRVYRSDIHDLLVRQDGQISTTDMLALMGSASPQPDAGNTIDLSGLDLASLLCNHGLAPPGNAPDTANAFRYREWDCCMTDYLPDRVRVLERDLSGSGPRFYQDTLDQFRGLVRRIRYAFELLRPEEMTILRQWREGDAFDYRALLDYAIDKKAGLMPSDRLFIKRMKRIRDVAALLLVDLSRSTANTVDARGTRVLDVEKQAIVLLCEALQVVGDRFAIAGFSGTGPLGVDYYRIKDLDAPLDDAVKGRISAMAPQRSTRMGAAIRHATAQLAQQQARVRLILVLGDGFPNDLEYKGAYAVEDTRRAVMEARAASIHVKAITVNVSDNGQLDRLYGQPHHTLIGNVQDLPDKLVRVYSALTRQ
jgi:nitric oxide reductase NorD protein